MSLSIIAAVGKNLELGLNNGLIWRFKEDMKFFKETTMGHPVIMGRKTFESLPKALVNRRNIVITTDTDYSAEGAEVVHSVEEAVELCGGEEAFVIGGGRIYSEMLPLCDKLYLTEIEAECKSADTFFPSFNKSDYISEKLSEYNVDGISFSHILYTLRKG